MKKAHSLRAFLANAVPELREQPERLKLFVEGGHILSTGSDSLSFVYRYTLRAVLIDFTADLDVLTVPVLLWCREHEPELLDNKERRENDLRFDVEVLNANAVDLVMQIDLTERVVVKDEVIDGRTRLTVRHPDEIWSPAPYATGDYALYLGDQIGSEWHTRPQVG